MFRKGNITPYQRLVVAEQIKKEVAERKQKEEAERKQKEEAERKQKEEAERKQKEHEEFRNSTEETIYIKDFKKKYVKRNDLDKTYPDILDLELNNGNIEDIDDLNRLVYGRKEDVKKLKKEPYSKKNYYFIKTYENDIKKYENEIKEIIEKARENKKTREDKIKKQIEASKKMNKNVIGVNTDKRSKNFEKELQIFKNHPNYEDVKYLYVNDNIKNIASARKQLNNIKLTTKGSIYKTSLPKQEKFLKEVKNIEKENQKIYTQKLSKEFLNLSKGKTKELNIDMVKLRETFRYNKEKSNKVLNALTKQFLKNQKPIINIKNKEGTIDKHYTVNDKNVDRIFNTSNWYRLKAETNKYSKSDADAEAEVEVADDINISLAPTIATNQKQSGKFFKYLNKTGIDLSDYQIYTKQQFEQNDHSECCLYFSLKKLGLEEQKLNSLKILIKDRNIPLCDLNKICDKVQININIKKITGERNRCLTYGKQYTDIYNIGLVDEHYFPIYEEKTEYTSYSIEHYDEIKHINEFNRIYCSKLKKTNDRYIDSFDLISLFVKHKDVLLEEMTFNNCNIANTQFYNKINDDIFNLNYDENKDCKLVVENIDEDEVDNIEKVEKVDDEYIVYFDFETYKDNTNFEHIPYLLCATYTKNNIVKDVKTFTGPNCGKNFIKSIDHDSILIAHNVSYDYRFIINELNEVNEISRGNKLIGCKAVIYNYNKKRINIKIKDSYHLIGQALDKFGKIFNLDVKKEVMPYDIYSAENINKKWIPLKNCLKYLKNEKDKELFINNIKEWDLYLEETDEVDILNYSIKYCQLDVDVLFKGYVIFRKWMKEYFDIETNDCLTIASLAHKYLINKGCYNDIYSLGGIPQKFIQGCVVGGRTMCANNEKDKFKTNGKTKMLDFDAVSLYPSAMNRMKGFLKGKPKVITNLDYDVIKQYDGYFIEILIKKVGIHRSFSLMSYMTEKGVRYFNNDMVGKIIKVDKTSLEDLIEFQKIEFDIIRGYYFNEGYNNKINDTIKYIFDKRAELKKIKNPAELTYKLIMNNAYGKSIMKPIETETRLFTNKKEFDVFLDRNYNWVKSYTTFGYNNNKYKVKVYKKLSDHFNICHVGVEILSMSKRIMNEVMTLAEDNKLKIYYQDTDSMHILEQDVNKLSVLFKKKYNRELIGKNMGQFHSDFDLEGAKNVYATKSIFLGKKSYIDVIEGKNDKGKLIKGYHIRLKGIPNTTVLYTAEKLKLTPYGLYQKLYKGEKIHFDITENGAKANFNFSDDYKIYTRKEFERCLQF